MLGHLTGVLLAGRNCPFGIVRDVFMQADVNRNLPVSTVEARLQPYLTSLHSEALKIFATICREHDIQPVILFRPSPTATDGIEHQRENEFVARLQRLGEAIDVPVLDLTAAFESRDENALTVSLWDDHTGARGHQLLANELLRQMTLREGLKAWQGTRTRLSTMQVPNAISSN
jgi:hypothetical protein